VIVSREVAATTPSSRPPRSWNGEGDLLGVVPLLRAEEESQVGLVVPEDVRPSEAETMILPRTPDESRVVDVARGLDICQHDRASAPHPHAGIIQCRLPLGGGQCEGFVWSCDDDDVCYI